MDINANLLSLTTKKVSDITGENHVIPSQAYCDGVQVTENVTGNSSCIFNNVSFVCSEGNIDCNSDIVSINGKEVNLFGSATDSQIINFVSNASLIESTTKPMATAKYNSDSSAATTTESTVIQALYDYYHPKLSFTAGYGFNDVDGLFTYLDGIYSGVKKSGQITKEQLTLLTQNDDLEDNNGDFFGVLNRAFSEKSFNDVITQSEINALLIKSAGNDYSCSLDEFQSKVLQYAQKVQNEFVSQPNYEAKMDFILDKTMDYLKASGLELQRAAMNRLLSGTDDPSWNHICNRGQIAFATFETYNIGDDVWVTNGAYTSWQDSDQRQGYVSPKTGENYEIGIWYGDEDKLYGEDDDTGLTLNVELLDGKWYEVVNVLVHELTHATAFYYYEFDYDSVKPTKKGLQYMLSQGALTQSEYNLYYNAFNGGYNNTLTEEQINRLIYLMNTMWGEYRAYQADADYLDSIGADILDPDLSTAASGANEASTITAHIDAGYNRDEDGNYIEYLNPKPDWDWWSYNNASYSNSLLA